MDHAGRRAALRGILEHPLLVTALPGIRYLTGFSGSNAALLVDPQGEDRFATDGRYRDQAASEVPDLEALLDRDTVRALVRHARPTTLLVEATLDLGTAALLEQDGVRLQQRAGLVESLRIAKDADEQALLERCNRITAQAIEQVLAEVRPGMSERAIARRLEQCFGELGADDRAFPTIVGAGEHSAIPHHQPGSREVAVGDLLLIDAGALVAGYHADMTRVAVVGAEPTPWQRELHAVVAAAAEAGRHALLPGADRRAVDAAARAVIEDAGLGGAFTHGLGHGTGLEIHEAPFLGPAAIGTIPEFASVTVEPGVYLPGRGGIRIEDSLLVEAGGARAMTPATRDLIVAG